MTTPPDLPEPDRQPGAPHPRETQVLLGQAAAEAEFLAAYTSGNLHHAWLIVGPKGVGKATLAWRIARFLLASPAAEAGPSLFGEPSAPVSLDIDADHPVARRLRALSEPRLHLVRRGLNQKGTGISEVIRVEEIRDVADFLHQRPADGGRRVVIIDAADDMNGSTANALLKFLEEPPRDVVFLLVSHRPTALLPTIRSRCRTLRLGPLEEDDMIRALSAAGHEMGDVATAITHLSEGAPGRAVELLAGDGPGLYTSLLDVLSSLPDIDRHRAVAFAERLARRGAGDEADLVFQLLEVFLARAARRGVMGTDHPEIVPGEAVLLARLSPDASAGRAWAELLQEAGARVRHGRAVNLDPAALLLDMVHRISETARHLADPRRQSGR